jgi:sterol desaturase/sphingolipid hydroxylase (fatty acid hydroxylase superfamily)
MFGKYLLQTSFFGAKKISYQDVTDLSKDSADLIVWAIPAMAFFTLIEMGHSWYTGQRRYNSREAFGSLLVGLGNVGINLLIKVGMIYSSVFFYNLVPWRMELNWWTLIPCFFMFDFCSYWSHRVSHFNRFFWCTHVVHHTAVHYNLTVSFRLSWIQNLKIFFFFPVIIAGFHPIVFFVVNQVMVLFQFWQHTEYIKKLPRVIEYIFITPSNHRVHHGSDEEYIDKNFGALFTFWDRMFGSFVPEGKRPTYGITKNIDMSANPLYLNFHELKDLVTDVKKAKGMRSKLFYAFGSPVKVWEAKCALAPQEIPEQKECELERITA